MLLIASASPANREQISGLDEESDPSSRAQRARAAVAQRQG